MAIVVMTPEGFVGEIESTYRDIPTENGVSQWSLWDERYGPEDGEACAYGPFDLGNGLRSWKSYRLTDLEVLEHNLDQETRERFVGEGLRF